MNKYLNTKNEIAQTNYFNRWKYYIGREFFRAIPIVDNGESLISEDALKALGVHIEPVWNDSSDIEGQAYNEYFKQHSLPGWIRTTVGGKLGIAAHTLRDQGYTLVLRAGFRPLQVQQMTFDAIVHELMAVHKDKTKLQVIEIARDYISDPSQLVPPHTAGAAVDVVLLNSSGVELDMGCPMNSDGDIAWADTDLISEQQKSNRSILRNAMLKAGFAPLGSEWWHFSYGDQIWAAYCEKEHALYGIYE